MKLPHIYASPDGQWAFTWHGGAYIDVSRPGQVPPFATINVYDYEAGRPTITTAAQVKAKATAWIKNDSADYIAQGY